MTDKSDDTVPRHRLELVPLTLKEARAFVATHHRHNEPPIGHKFSIGLENGELRAVVIAGHPVSRMGNDGRTIELLRVTTLGDRNACSRLYSAACRAAAAMGYRRAVTFTLEDEDGASLRASGFHRDGQTAGGQWIRPNQAKRKTSGALLSLWGDRKMPTGPKTRWVRDLR